MDDLSIIVPSYNNVRHLKNCYHSIRKWYPELEILMLDDGSDDGTWEWLSAKVKSDEHLLPMKFDERVGHTILYDEGIEAANNRIVGILHADMLVTRNTFENMLKHLGRGKVVCSTRVEPPLHPAGDEKIIKDFGRDFDSLDVPAFEQFAQRMEKEYKDETTEGMFAPWIIYKEDYNIAGGHDHIFAPFPYEDSDIFQRWILEDFELIQARDSFVYHLTCRGHRWNEEIGKNDEEYKGFEERARRNFIRKWGNWITNDRYHHPVIYPKYDVGFVVHNCTRDVYRLVEPWCSDIYIDDKTIIGSNPNRRNIESQILMEKVHSIDKEVDNDVIVEFDADKFTQEHYQRFITNINKVIDNSVDEGEFEWEIFSIKINKKEPFDKNHYKPIYKTEL